MRPGEAGRLERKSGCCGVTGMSEEESGCWMWLAKLKNNLAVGV